MRFFFASIGISLLALWSCSQSSGGDAPGNVDGGVVDGGGVQTLARPVQMNDVSILLPLASTQADFDAYVKADDLVPKDLFGAFNVPGKTAVGTGGPELDYASLRLVGVRLDPCFANIGPITDPSTCQNQIRLVMQALTFDGSATTAEDTALHLFYSVSRGQLLEAANAITQLRIDNGDPNADLGPLAMHPIVVKQGVAGAMASGIAGVIKKYATTANLVRMTRMYSSSDFWDFNGIDIDRGVAKDMVIPDVPDNGSVVSFTEPTDVGGLNGSFVPSPNAADNIATLTSVSAGNAATPEQRQAAFDAMLRIENPNFHSPNTIDCASCHVSEVARVINAPTFSLDATGDAFAFVAPAGVAAADLALTAPVKDQRNFHAFSYRVAEPRINQRVVNETASVVSYLDALPR